MGFRLADVMTRKRKRLEAKSGGKWDEAYLKSLKISIVSTSDPTAVIQNCDISQEARDLIQQLAGLTLDELIDYPRIILDADAPEKFFLPIYKAIYLTHKYKDHESAVDCLLGHLLSALGFNKGRLFSFPQLRVPLRFGDDAAEDKFAIADFTILDIVSFYRTCFCEDKSVKQELKDCGPQIVAEGMALHQLNSHYSTAHVAVAASDPTILPSPLVGVRVSGFLFYFYSIPYSDAVLTAMRTREVPEEPTEVTYYPADGLNFLAVTDRCAIISLLDMLQSSVAQSGTASIRRSSKLA